MLLYGESAGGERPAFFRRGGPAELQQRIDSGELAPAFGPSRLDPRAGAVLIGARPLLIAFNVELRTGSLEDARAIAAAIRASSGGMPGVQALGLLHPATGLVQVSINVIDVEQAPLVEVVARVREAVAGARGGGGAERARRPAAGACGRGSRCCSACDELPDDRVLERAIALL